jgi:F0F1-type ATP synthase assembly protein I
MPDRRDHFRFAGVGVHFAATIGVFALLGYWADRFLGTSPWLLLVGVFLGFGLGLTSLVAKLGPRQTTKSPKEPTGAARGDASDSDHP